MCSCLISNLIVFQLTAPPSPLKRRGPSAQPSHLAPLKINIPSGEEELLSSPLPSPTGTISAANSCPVSPRDGSHMANRNHFGGFSHFHNELNTSTHSNNHYGNNNSSNMSCQELSGQDHSPNADAGNEGAKDDSKPPYSYAQLIVQAICTAPDKQLTLSGIYSYITKNYPYYRTADKGWQVNQRRPGTKQRLYVKLVFFLFFFRTQFVTICRSTDISLKFPGVKKSLERARFGESTLGVKESW